MAIAEDWKLVDPKKFDPQAGPKFKRMFFQWCSRTVPLIELILVNFHSGVG